MTVHVRPTPDTHAQVDANGILLAAMLAEVASTATEAQERAFLLAAGQRIADVFPLAGLIDLSALATRMNEIWRMLDLGDVQLVVDDNGIAIEHRRSAGRCAVAEEQWDRAEPVLLESIYGQWFAAIGSDRLSLKIVSRSYDRISFHYGR